ncbi:DUF5906 domain-containing protein [uncultured Stenotrophomonas sp.]|uniref:DUF5906 domain-containing protein n=1 Tax=uncultured Stenotrophomonas sp. TaxID=165438 RepID=UPI0028D81E32|nr:DUF5906 domain-containing protein [uncultured Stenotrophomonas sp.]
MSTNTLSNSAVVSTPSPTVVKQTKPKAGQPKIKKINSANIIPSNTPAWNWLNYLNSGKCGDWAKANGLAYKWNGVFWDTVSLSEGTALASRFLFNHMPDKATNAASMDCFKFAVNSLEPLPERDGSTFVIAAKNGYLHVGKDGAISVLPADKKLGLTFGVNATVSTSYNKRHTPQAVPANSLFGRFLASALPDLDIRALVQEQCALTLIPGPHQLVWWWVGTGGNGKGVMSSIVRGFHHRTAQIWLDKCGEPQALASCINSSLIFTPEVKRGARGIDQEAFKALSGGDLLTAKFLYRDMIEFVNTSCHIVSSNDEPMITDATDGMYRRLCVVKWNQRHGTYVKIPNLAERILKEEAHIVLDWLLEGVSRIVKRGGFLPENEWPEATQMFKKSIRNKNDCVGAWREEVGIVPDAQTLTPKKDVYKSYVQFCEGDGRYVLSAPQFWTRFWAMPGFERPQSARGDTQRIAGVQVNCVRARIPAEISWELPTGEIIVQRPIKSAPPTVEPKAADNEPMLITLPDKDFSDEQWSF